MQVIKVELLDDKVLQLLQQLEKLKLIRLSPPTETESTAKRQWAGSLSKETAAKMLHHVEKLRNEWERT